MMRSRWQCWKRKEGTGVVTVCAFWKAMFVHHDLYEVTFYMTSSAFRANWNLSQLFLCERQGTPRTSHLFNKTNTHPLIHTLGQIKVNSEAKCLSLDSRRKPEETWADMGQKIMN